MTWSSFRCESGHEWNAIKVRQTCPFGRCNALPLPAHKGPLSKKIAKKEGAK